MDGIFTAENLTKTFGTGKTAVTAVNDVSFALQKGQITTIVGESGSGKSTIARMVLGLLPITSGTVTFQGKDVTNPKGNDRAKYWRGRAGGVPGPVLGVQPVLHRARRCSTARCGCCTRASARTAWKRPSVTSGWICRCWTAIPTSCRVVSDSG